jgi:hypothetical protein
MLKFLTFFRTVLVVLLAVSASKAHAQAPFWTDDFENTGSPTTGSVRTPSLSFTNGDAYFNRINSAAPGITFYNLTPYTSQTGSYYWAGQDHDDANTKAPEQAITWTNIDITGKTNIIFKGKFACNNASDAWENKEFPGSAFSHTDYIILEYAVDNNPTFTALMHFKAEDITAATGKRLSRDVDFNGIGDGPSYRPSKAFSYFSQAINVSGTKLTLRLRAYSNGLYEEWAIDDFSFTQANTLPVVLNSFVAKPKSDAIQLKWETFSESGNNYFEIYKSGNAKDFSKIGKVEAKGGAVVGANYIFEDKQPFFGANYYRLVQVDLNGEKQDVSTTTVNYSLAEENALIVFPNPTADKATLHFSKDVKRIELLDINGRLLHFRDLKLEEGQIEIPMARFAKGVYIVKSIMKDNTVITRKINKI